LNKLNAHSIYLTAGSKAAIPEKIVSNLDSFKRCYSDFEHVLYTDDSLRTFIADHFEFEVVWAYDQLIPLAYKADLGRYCLLYKLGGIYADLSITFFQRIWFDDFGDQKIIFFRDGFSHAPWIISNSILMAKPGQLIFKRLIEQIVEHAKTKYYGFNPLCPTGPNLLGRTAAQLLEMEDFVTGEVIRINKNPSTWSYSYLIPNGEVVAVNVKIGNGLSSLGVKDSDNYNDHWHARNVYKDNHPVDDQSPEGQTKQLQQSALAHQAAQAALVIQESQVRIQQAQSQIQDLSTQLVALHASKSWRLTSPLRWLLAHGKRLIHAPDQAPTKPASPAEPLAPIQAETPGQTEPPQSPSSESDDGKVQEPAAMTAPRQSFNYGLMPVGYTQTLEVIHGECYENICIDATPIYFHTQVFQDVRGIGRHARELAAQLRAMATAGLPLKTPMNPPVYFFSTIHWCPQEIPENSTVLIHDIIPMIFPSIFGNKALEMKYKCDRLFAKAKNIITISNSAKADILKYFEIPSEKINVVFNGVTQFESEAPPSVKIPESDYFVFMGTADPHKNLGVVLKAIQQDPQLKLVLIGHENSFQRWLSQHNNVPEGSVFLAGNLSDAEAAFVIKRAVAMVFPSLYEGFGLPPLEAALQGVPTICSKRPAMTEILEGAAFFVDPSDPSQWVEAMNILRVNRNIRKNIADAARAKVSQYTWTKAALNLLNIFK
jgi:glycosyltransferase involved in cell wall biosynthesis